MRRRKDRRDQYRKLGKRGEAMARPPSVEPADPIEELIARAQRSRRRGDLRRALVLLREACSLDEWRARSWTLNAALLEKIGHTQEAAQAYRQARWLRSRAGERSRVNVLDRLIARVTAAAA